MAPPEYRSYKLTKTHTRGDKVILEDISHGRRKDEAKRIQHVMHDGKIVYTVKESGDCVIKYFKSDAISIQEQDLNGDGRMDLLFLMPLGTEDVLEGFSIKDGKFLTPVSSDDLFDKHGNKRSMADLLSRMNERISQQSP